MKTIAMMTNGGDAPGMNAVLQSIDMQIILTILYGIIVGFSFEIYLFHVLEQHPLRVKERAIQRDGVAHDVQQTVTVLIIEWKDDLL